jgi:hypothetical protein
MDVEFIEIDNEVKLMYVNSVFENKMNTASDINEHIQKMYTYALECDRIVELGVDSGNASWAFVKALLDSKMIEDKPKSLVNVTMKSSAPLEDILKSICDGAIDYKLLTSQNTVTADIGPSVDLLFIDSWHVYGHIKRELDAHYKKVKKYIIMHDTEVDKYVGESIRCGMDIVKQSKDFSYPIMEITCGIRPAIDLFLEEHGDEFEMVECLQNNHGLIVLKRR